MDRRELDPSACIVAVDDDASSLALLQDMLERRFGADYRIVASDSGRAALESISGLVAERSDICVILARQRMAGMSGVELLREAGRICPEAHRAVLIGARDLTTEREEILRAAAVGEIDTYLVAPDRPRDEAFFRAIAQFLDEWDREHRPQTELLKIVGDRWDPDVYRIRDALHRSGVIAGFYDSDSAEGLELLARAGLDGPLPVVLRFDGVAVARPTNVQIAELLDVNTDPTGRDFDVVVVGAGPAGMAAAVYGSSEGLDTLLVESEALGGQASTSSMIRNYLGFPRGLTGADLAARAYLQAWFFGSEFLIGREAMGLRVEGDRRVLILDGDIEVRTKAVVLACGVSYRRLEVENLERFVGRGVFYGAPVTEAWAVTGSHAVVIGGGNSSAQSALALARRAAKVTLVARHPELDEMSEYLIQDIRAHDNIEVRLSTVLVDASGDTRLEAVTLRNVSTGVEEQVPAAAVFILIGAEPRTEWLPPEIERDERGYIPTGSDVKRRVAGARPPYSLETSMPGVFAAGDVRFNGLKRVASAVGEGSRAIRNVHEYLAEIRRAARAD